MQINHLNKYTSTFCSYVRVKCLVFAICECGVINFIAWHRLPSRHMTRHFRVFFSLAHQNDFCNSYTVTFLNVFGIYQTKHLYTLTDCSWNNNPFVIYLLVSYACCKMMYIVANCVGIAWYSFHRQVQKPFINNLKFKLIKFNGRTTWNKIWIRKLWLLIV